MVQDSNKEFIEFKLDNKPYKIVVESKSSMFADFYGGPYFRDKPSSRTLYTLKTSFIKANAGDIILDINSVAPIKKMVYKYITYAANGATPNFIFTLPPKSPAMHDGFMYITMLGRSTGAIELTEFSDDPGDTIKGRFHFENLGYYHLDSVAATSWGHKITEGRFSIVVGRHFDEGK
jgi:hypothetical protein